MSTKKTNPLDAVWADQGVRVVRSDQPHYNTFGASDPTFGSDGAPTQFEIDQFTGKPKISLEICPVCEVASGGTRMGILRENEISCTLLCPNCGENITRPTSSVKHEKVIYAPRT